MLSDQPEHRIVTSAAHWTADRNNSFYGAMGAVALVAVAIGFSTTYFIPVSSGAFSGPLIVHVHGLLFIAWVTMALLQPILVRRGKSRLHRKFGLVALPLALIMAGSGLEVGIYVVSRDLAAGVGEVAYAQLIGVVSAMILFVIYVSIAIIARKKPDWHKRMMLMATVTILWPAWFRFRHLLPALPRPDIILGVIASDSLILVAMVRDRFRFGRVHPAYLVFGLLLVSEHVSEVLLFDTPNWRAVAKLIYQARVSAIVP